MSLSAFRLLFQPVFENVLREKTQKCASLISDPFVTDLIRYPETVAGGNGKRVRPYLLWLMAGMSDDAAQIRLTSALELFHAFALAHDDVIDHGTMRHGVPTVHTYAEARMKQAHRVGDLAHVGNAQAILVGDLFFQWSREVFEEGAACYSADRLNRARAVFNAMIREVIVGQMVDVDIATRTEVTMELIHTKMRLKTASYTFVRPMHIGMALAGTDTEAAWATQYGLALGTAFQMQDDLIDLTATSVEAGKTVFSDLRANQPTVFTQYIVEHATDAQRTALAALMGGELTEAHRERVTRLFTDSGATAFGESEIARLLAEADAALMQAPEVLHQPLRALVDQVRQRKS